MIVEVKKYNRRVYLVGDNGLVLAVSEQYATVWNAKRAARRMFPELEKLLIDQYGGATRLD